MPSGDEGIRAKVRDLLSDDEIDLRTKLAQARKRSRNPTDKGSSAESVFRSFLRTYLPRKYGVGQGEAWDQSGRVSSQIDAVIVSDDHPFTYRDESPGLFFVEGIQAAIEVKTTLTTGELTRSIETGRRFKTLETVHASGAQPSMSETDFFRFGLHPPSLCFAYESDLSLTTIMGRLKKAGGYQRGLAGGTFDAIFVLGKGWVIDFGAGDGMAALRHPDNGSFVTGWQGSKSDAVLRDMLGWLYVVMPRIASPRGSFLPYLLPNLD